MDYRKPSIRDKIAKSYVKHIEENAFNMDGFRLMLLPHLFPVKHRVKINNKMQKVSVDDIQKALLIWSKVCFSKQRI